MVKYLGSKITAFAAFVIPLFICCPLVLGFSALCVEISSATVFLMFGCILCTFIWWINIKNVRNQLYSWGRFHEKGVQVITGLSKSNMLVYEKCKDCGIGYYTHGILNSRIGTKIYFIYLSYDIFDEAFRANINLWKPSKTQIKIEFSQKLYDYLLVVLPRKQSKMLYQDYEKYLKKR